MADSVGLALAALMLNNAPVTTEHSAPRFGWEELLQRIADELHILEDGEPFLTPIFELYASLHDPLDVDFMSCYGWRKLCLDSAGAVQDRVAAAREVRLIFPTFLLALARLGMSELLGVPTSGSLTSRTDYTPADVEAAVQRITEALRNARRAPEQGDAGALLTADVVKVLRREQQML
ncbi:unnamed protein product, partial [Symbiodinium sp. KB8]